MSQNTFRIIILVLMLLCIAVICLCSYKLLVMYGIPVPLGW